MFDQEYFDAGLYRKGTDCIKWDMCQREHGPVLPMWVADMDFPSPPAVQAALLQRAAHPTYGYTESGAEYAKSLCGFWKRHHGVDVDPESIVDLPCVVTGLKVAIQAFTEPGDGVIIQRPVYGPFIESTEVTGRREMDASLIRDENGRYHMDLDKVEQFCREGAKLMMLCNPHNPVSRAWTREELSSLVSILNKYHVALVSDEIHADFVYAPLRFHSMLSVPGAAERTLMLTAASKTFNIPGLQQATAVSFSARIIKALTDNMEMQGVTSGNVFALPATQAAYNQCDDWLDGMLDYLTESRKILADALAEALPKAILTPIEATALSWLDLRAYDAHSDSLDRKLRAKHLVLNNGASFGQANGDGFMRLNFACPHAVLREAVRRLAEALNE